MLDGLYAADRQHLQMVLEETKRMARLLEDLRTLSTAEAGALVLHREHVAPLRLVEDAIAAFASRAEDRGVRLAADVAPGLPDIGADPFRLGEVLSNLLSNAIRHTPSGGSVTVGAAPDGDRIAFRVADTGSGIAPEHLAHVFDRYVKASDSGGSGLGLAIARTLVEAHGGAITAESEPGHGTTIRFTIPRSV
jgi:two-component system sensor histidine kinase BaeS